MRPGIIIFTYNSYTYEKSDFNKENIYFSRFQEVSMFHLSWKSLKTSQVHHLLYCPASRRT